MLKYCWCAGWINTPPDFPIDSHNLKALLTFHNSEEFKKSWTKNIKEIKDYTEAYGSESYGMTAYLLNKIRIYSIPCCFVGIAVAAIYQYVIGVRKIDVRDRGLQLMIGFITIFVIAQVLPLIFAIVVKSWRG